MKEETVNSICMAITDASIDVGRAKKASDGIMTAVCSFSLPKPKRFVVSRVLRHCIQLSRA